MTYNKATHLFVQVLWRQSSDLMESLLSAVDMGFDTANAYMLHNQHGNSIMHLAEESECLTRQLCGSRREFTMHASSVHCPTTVSPVC